MKWINVSNNSSNLSYELWNDEIKLVSLSISNRTKISRIECATDKRLFFIEKTGFLHSKTIIKNEYGIRLGELIGENRDAHEGMIELEGKKYAYSFNNITEAGLVIYDESKKKPLVSCHLSSPVDQATAVVKRSRSLHDTAYPSLLLAICWYLLKPAATAALSNA